MFAFMCEEYSGPMGMNLSCMAGTLQQCVAALLFGCIANLPVGTLV